MKFKIFVFILNFLPKTIAHKLLYLKIMEKKLNLKSPESLNEKLQWLIINEYGIKEANLTDKILSKKILFLLQTKKTYVIILSQTLSNYK